MPGWDEAREHTLDALIQAAINGDGDDVPSGIIAERVMARVLDGWKAGHPWAEPIMRKGLREGIRRRVTDLVKRQKGTVYLPSGRSIDLPTHVGVTVTTKSGGDVRQLSLWWKLPWPEFEKVVKVRAEQRRILTREIRGYNEVLQLRLRFPESRTPEEACKAMGVDPRSFKLDEDLA